MTDPAPSRLLGRPRRTTPTPLTRDPEPVTEPEPVRDPAPGARPVPEADTWESQTMAKTPVLSGGGIDRRPAAPVTVYVATHEPYHDDSVILGVADTLDGARLIVEGNLREREAAAVEEWTDLGEDGIRLSADDDDFAVSPIAMLKARP